MSKHELQLGIRMQKEEHDAETAEAAKQRKLNEEFAGMSLGGSDWETTSGSTDTDTDEAEAEAEAGSEAKCRSDWW